MLVSARALQGAFGAILAPAALGTLVSTFRDPRERGRAFAVFGSVAVGGGAVGLLLGGLLTQYLSWRYTLFVNLIFAAFAVVGALAFIRSSRPAVRPRMDWPGAVFAVAGLFLIVFGFSHAETASWTASLTLGSLALGTLLLVAFVPTGRSRLCSREADLNRPRVRYRGFLGGRSTRDGFSELDRQLIAPGIHFQARLSHPLLTV
jgi:MFS family permease